MLLISYTKYYSFARGSKGTKKKKIVKKLLIGKQATTKPHYGLRIERRNYKKKLELILAFETSSSFLTIEHFCRRDHLILSAFFLLP